MNRYAHLSASSYVHGPASSGAHFSKVWLRLALVAVMAGSSLSGTRLYAESSATDFKQGEAAEAREDYDTAYADYQKAFQKNPKDLRFRTALDRTRVSASTAHMTKGRKLVQSGDNMGALSEFLHATEIDPGNEAAQQEIAKLRQQQGQAPQPGAEVGLPEAEGEAAQLDSIGAPAALKPVSNEPLTLHMTEDAKVIYQAMGKAAGVNVLFDPDYNSKRIAVDLTNVSLLDGLRIVGTISGTFWRPVTANTIFVAQNTRAKRTELDEKAVQTFYLTNAWQQNDLNDVQTALRNVMPNAHFFAVASQNAVVASGTPDELLLAEKLIHDLDKPRSEVVVDIGVLEVSKNWEKTLGIAWPSTIGVALQSPTASSTSCPTGSTTCTPTTGTSTGTSPTLYNLAHLNSNDFAVTVGSATLNLLLTDDNTQILQDPRIRATDGQKATLTIGSKIPIATGSYQTGAATALVSSLVNTQFQYIDVGVKVEMTPTVHFDDDVTLKVHIEVSTESNSVTISGVTEPIISQRIVDQVIRLREGEASILGGIENKQDMQTWSGIPGLSSIPILKYLFGSKDHQIMNDEVVFVVVPHVVRSQTLDQQNLRAIDTGEGQNIELRHVASNAPGTQAAIAPGLGTQVAVRPATAPRPAAGTVPGNTAPAAAMAALAQIRTAADAVDNPQATGQASAAPPSPFANQLRPPAPANAAAVPAAAPPANTPQAGAPPPPAAPSFKLSAPANAAVGSSFQVPVVLFGGANVASVPLHLQYDPAKLTLVNVLGGDYLSKDGQAVALIHRDDGPGNVVVVASRPPGTAGITGDGTVCVLTFQGKAPGQTALTITQAGIVDSNQQQVAGQGSGQGSGQGAQVSIVVN